MKGAFFWLATVYCMGLSAQELHLGSDVWPPFTNVEGEKAVALALVKEALDRGQLGSRFSILEFGEVMEGINGGTLDGSAALWKTPEREKTLVFSDPYLENRLILVGRKGSPADATSLSELAGRRVGVVANYAYGASVDSALGVIFVEGGSDQENLDRLLAGEVDYMLVDDLLIQYITEHQKEEAAQYLEIGSVPLVRRTLHFAIRKDLRGADYMVQRFNRMILQMEADGTYNQILQVNWIRADVDGDGRLELIHSDKRAGAMPPAGGYGVPGKTPLQPGLVERYYFDGKVYEGWENVPGKYKRPDLKPEDVNKPGATLRFNF